MIYVPASIYPRARYNGMYREKLIVVHDLLSILRINGVGFRVYIIRTICYSYSFAKALDPDFCVRTTANNGEHSGKTCVYHLLSRVLCIIWIRPRIKQQINCRCCLFQKFLVTRDFNYVSENKSRKISARARPRMFYVVRSLRQKELARSTRKRIMRIK